MALSERQLAQRRAAVISRTQRQAALPKCGRPTRRGTPCTLPLINGRCLTHDTMTAEERAAHCRKISALGARNAVRGEAHPAWKGEHAQRHTGRHRAQRLYAAQPCQDCGAGPETTTIHRHHVDGDPLNNAPSNIQFLCVPCHAVAHGGRFTWFDPSDPDER